MPGDRFFDTCILIYALLQKDHREVTAKHLLSEGGIVSVQVLNEFAAAGRGKFQLSLDAICELSSASVLLCDAPLPLTLHTHQLALQVAQRYGFHFYDCLIVASALESGCTTLFTEDLQHDQRIEGLTVVNPFLASLTQ